VYSGKVDNITGFVLKDTFLEEIINLKCTRDFGDEIKKTFDITDDTPFQNYLIF